MKNEKLKNGKKNPKTLKIKEEQDLKQNKTKLAVEISRSYHM
jgi:hypothetical protein